MAFLLTAQRFYAVSVTKINHNLHGENTPNKAARKIKHHFSPRNGGDNPGGQGDAPPAAYSPYPPRTEPVWQFSPPIPCFPDPLTLFSCPHTFPENSVQSPVKTDVARSPRWRFPPGTFGEAPPIYQVHAAGRLL